MNKMILISNRLPVTVIQKTGQFFFNQSVGGLATGLSSYHKNGNAVWIGFSGIPGDELKEQDKQVITEKLKNQFHCLPVHLTNHEINHYYFGFSNNTIWPLFHYFLAHTIYDDYSWQVYQAVNKKFQAEVCQIAEDGDMIWVHDYQLMLLPQLLRERLPNSKIGFFLHIPFPSFEIFRLLPWRKEIMEGLLGSDLIGFHTFSYMRHFLSSMQRLIGYENNFGKIKIENRVVEVDAFPMGIDYDKFYQSSNNPKVKEQVREIISNKKKQRLILSIDRLDYTKGLIQRLEGFNYFLENYPQYREKVTLVIVAVPSRTQIDTYHELKSQIDEFIGRINGKYSTVSWEPIWYMYRSLPFETLSALYSISEVALLTPLRDGMNLVAKEFIAAKLNNRGVLILSEMAGVAEELGEAIIINPNNKKEIGEALNLALNMSLGEQIEQMKIMKNRLQRNNVFKWANDFIERLDRTRTIHDKHISKYVNSAIMENIFFDYQKSKQRLILLNYDGTLVPYYEKKNQNKPDKELLQLLKRLIDDEKNNVVIYSARSKSTLEKWFAHLNVNIIAEHGIWIKERGKEWDTLIPLDNHWKKNITPILEKYVDRTPGSSIEKKKYSLTWKYSKTDLEFASMRVNELIENLLNQIANSGLGILEGDRYLMIKNLEIDKGKAAIHFVNNTDSDFILALGDDRTDEEIFNSLAEDSYAIKVGLSESKADYFLYSYQDVREFLKKILG